MDEEVLIFGAILALLIGGLVWAVIEDDREMTEKKAAFYEACLKDRKLYDCELQWGTFEAAHNAEVSAAVAVGVAAGSAAGRK